VKLSVEDDHRLPWLAGVPGARILRPGIERTEVELDEGTDPDAVLAPPSPPGRGSATSRSRTRRSTDLHRPRRPFGGGRSDRPAGRHAQRHGRRGAAPGRRMSLAPDRPPERHEPAFPNTTHVAPREYAELVRSRLFHVSTTVLAVLAIIVALLPIVVRLVERAG